jgi:predicted Zn-dependent protease
VSLADAEQGNSFIPRLWARMHLDQLLQQGSSQAIQDEIIALSEEYNIMTPYTSLLVLENDADRERFKVKRRFAMRDGEKFFADGRDNVNYELTQQQMRRAGLWRLGLRRSVLAQLSGLGRNPAIFAPGDVNGPQGGGYSLHLWGGNTYTGTTIVSAGTTIVSAGTLSLRAPDRMMLEKQLGGWDVDGSFDGTTGETGWGKYDSDSLMDLSKHDDNKWEANESAGERSGFEVGDTPMYGVPLLDKLPYINRLFAEVAVGRDTQSLMMMVNPRIIIQEEEEEKLGIATESWDLLNDRRRTVLNRFSMTAGDIVDPGELGSSEHRLRASGLFDAFEPPAGPLMGFKGSRGWGGPRGAYAKVGDFAASPQYAPYYGDWLGTLFPHLPPAPAKERWKEPKQPWPADAKAIATSLLRIDALAKLQGGMRFERQSDSFDARFAEPTSRLSTLALVAQTSWLTRSETSGSQTTLNWCDRQERGTIAGAFQLGRLRAAQPTDLKLRAIGLDLSSSMYLPLDRAYPETDVEVKPQGENRVLLHITYPTNSGVETHYLIDTARHVALSTETWQDGKLTASTKYDAFVEVAGAWWPGRVESFDAKGRRTGLVTQKYTVLSADVFAVEIKRQLAGRDQVQFLREPLPKLLDAKRALATGKAGFEDQLTMAAYFAATQQWTKVQEHLEAAEKLAAGKQGMRWVRNAVLNMSRRREELKTRITDEAARLAKAPAGENDLFLANHLLGQSANILEANEMLRLLDALKPVFDRQPAFTLATKQWRQQRVNYWNQTGQAQEAMKLLGQLAADYPRDYSLQQQYANALAGVGEHEAALKLLEELLNGKTEWLPYEADSLCGAYSQLMQNQGRWNALHQFLTKWIERSPESTSHYQQYLSVMVRLDKETEAGALAARWLKEGQVEGKLPPAAAARLGAALSYMQGQCQGIYMNRLDEQWLRPMADAAIFFARHESLGHLADQIMSSGQFTQTDECRRVRKAAATMLAADVEKLKPNVIGRLVNWAMANDPAVEQQQWRKIADALRKRWDAEMDIGVKNQLAGPLVQILSSRLTPPEWIDFLRVQWQRGRQQGSQEYRPGYAAQLFEAITAQPWTGAYENEAFSLLGELSNAEEPVARLAAQIAALHRLTDRMVEGRYQAKVKEIEHPEKLTRIELRAKQAEARKLARDGFADWLREEVSRREGPMGPMAPWLIAERLYLDVLAGRNLDKAAEECWEFVGPAPRAALPAENTDGMAALDAALRARLLTMLANLAARKNAPAGSAERLLKYVDAGIAASDKDDLRWRTVKYQLLVALDRPKELEQALREWIAAEGPLNRWRLTLGYLLAEQGKLGEAIALFEAVAATDELGPAEYRTLADWQMAVNRRDAYERAMISAYKTVDEWRLSNLLWQKLQPWQRRDAHVPSELDKEVLLVFPALFEKSPGPQSYLGQLQQFYRETRDFRLLACLADAVVGHTAGKVYPLLQGMSGVLAEVRDEATADSLVEQLAKVRRRAKTDVDRRAVDLLEVLVERRASEVINQPGPHVEKALGAMQRAFQRQWSPGEPRLMADFLGALGNIAQERLAAEQTRQLELLYQQAAEKTADRLHIAMRLANVHWAYARQDAAIDLLALELREHQAASGGILPVGANEPLGTLVSYFEQRRHYVRGEDVLFEQLKHPANAGQKTWLTQRLYELYENALRNDGEVSLGKGADLYHALVKQLQANLDTGDPNHRYNLLNRLCTIFRAAHEKKFPGVADDVRAFAFQRFPEALTRDLNNYSSMVSAVAQTLRDVASPRDGLAFLIERIEREPRWLRYSNQDGWQQHGWQIAQWRAEVKDIGDLEPRLLKLVLAELRADLQSRQQRNRTIYHRGNGHYWAEKEKDFARTAEEVYNERKNSGAAAAYIADYLYHGLAYHPRAIEILLIAWKQGLLEEGAESQLVQYLQWQQRYGESIAVLLPLVERRPDNMQYRVWLMHAYFHTQQPAQLLALLKQTDGHFHKGGRWTEGNMAALARGCLDCQLFEQAAKYYQEVIPLHQRTAPNRGIGDGTLSEYYRCLALTFAGLKNTSEAVEAACGSIVSWGPRHEQRNQALESLKQVLRQSPDLDAYVAQLDKKCAETGLHSPIVRKALGQIYLERRKFDAALVQLKLAVELQPNDTETHQAILACCDQRGDKEGGVRQLLESVQLSRRDIALYQDLGRRYAELNRPVEAERAVTSIVEMLPAESESHAALAEIRQIQNRWNEAIDQWRQVARIRALEPTGLLKLAEAQIHRQLWDDADATVRQLESRTWPSRFGDADNQTRQLRQRIELGRKAK